MASLIAALVGPFGTFIAMTFDQRLFYWGGLIGVAIILAVSIRKVVLSVADEESVVTDLVGSAAMAVTLGPSICLFNGLVMGKDVLSLVMLFHHVLVVFVVSLAVALVRLYIRATTVRPGELPDTFDAAAEAPGHGACHVPDYLRDLAPDLGKTLRWIRADDHYLVVETEAGSARVLMRFRDALKELGDLPGLRVHRSHWVALAAVQAVRPDGRRHVAVLDCGTEVPVSRAYLEDLRAAGLMRDGEA
ncbi:LytTR family transcriptional regulator [Roseibacterium sp. SDUM158016]|uniref:LytTR family DNA-binding domain-containing protein n=1 Tax=Roseicyclus sediminis TaxID=2980997 RepID=UPI0021CEA547|nr:LytTR family DNA-binding domain-containing protein [Roseibacterium sp. SDUM158016]MCU4655196.1 LytTR family transcriptional regulator [Roseibacterium sp. SDUM158016]